MNNKINVVFVCMGNICRSPTGQAVFENLVESKGLSDKIHVDSAGTHAYHVGEPPDARSQRTAQRRGIDMSTQRARRVEHDDFDNFDYVLAMDQSNYDGLVSMASVSQSERIHLFMDFAASGKHKEVPDPYYGGSNGFERVLDMVAEASEGLLADILEKHNK